MLVKNRRTANDRGRHVAQVKQPTESENFLSFLSLFWVSSKSSLSRLDNCQGNLLFFFCGTGAY